MQLSFAIEAEGLELGIAVCDAGTFRFYAAQAHLSGLERLRFVSLHDIQRTVRRCRASQAAKAPQRLKAELPRSVALRRWRGLKPGFAPGRNIGEIAA